MCVCVLFLYFFVCFSTDGFISPPLGPVTFDRRDTVRATGPVGTGGATGPAAPHHQRVGHSASDSNKLTAGTPTFHKAKRHASTKSRIDSDKLPCPAQERPGAMAALRESRKRLRVWNKLKLFSPRESFPTRKPQQLTSRMYRVRISFV